MRHDEELTEESTAQRVSRILDQARRTPPPQADNLWPQEWPPGTSGDPDPGDHPGRPGPRWQIPVPAAVTAAVLAVLVVGLAAVLLLRPAAPGTVLPPRDPVVSGGGATGLADAASSGSGPSSGGLASGSSGAVAAGGPIGTQASTASDAGQVRVYVVGQVRRPGVVTLPVGARVEDAVQAVGGAGAKADLAVMNLARKVVDGERIVVPRPGEKLAATDPIADPGADPVTGAATGGAGGATAPGPGAPVDLNTATVAQLDALPGVGPVIAARIIAWRQENGRFSTVDDLSEVQGIGDATMTKLRPLVRV